MRDTRAHAFCYRSGGAHIVKASGCIDPHSYTRWGTQFGTTGAGKCCCSCCTLAAIPTATATAVC